MDSPLRLKLVSCDECGKRFPQCKLKHHQDTQHPRNCSSFIEDSIDIYEDMKNVIQFENHQEAEKSEARVILNTDEATITITGLETKELKAVMTLPPIHNVQRLSLIVAKYDKLLMRAMVTCERLPDTQKTLDAEDAMDTEDTTSNSEIVRFHIDYEHNYARYQNHKAKLLQ